MKNKRKTQRKSAKKQISESSGNLRINVTSYLDWEVSDARIIPKIERIELDRSADEGIFVGYH